MTTSLRRFVAVVGLGLAVGCLLAALPSFALAEPTPSPTATPTLTVTAAPAVVTADAGVSLTANLGVPIATVQLSAMVAGEAVFTPIGIFTTDAAGLVSWSLAPQSTTTYRVDFAGDATWVAAGAETTVAVRPRMRLSGVGGVYQGKRVVFHARVIPAHPGATVLLERRKKNGDWVLVKELLLDADSRPRFSWKSDHHGRLRFRLTMAADAGHVAGRSRVCWVRIKDPNPYGVPIAEAHYIVVDISQYRLYYHEYGRIVRVFDCVLGRPSLPTPQGHYKIYAMDAHMYGAYGPRRMRYMGDYAIHGTDEPWLLNRFPRNYSHGCTRLANTNVLWLFDRCRVGTHIWNVP